MSWGTLLFLIFINDLPSYVDKTVASKLFADDFKAYNLDDYRLNPESTQKTLDSLNEWAEIWQLELAIPKCGSLLLNTGKKFVDETELLVGYYPLMVFQTVLDLENDLVCLSMVSP